MRNRSAGRGQAGPATRAASARSWPMKTDMHNHAVPESAMRLLSRNPSYGVTVDAGFHLSGSPEGAYTVEAPFRDPPAKLANLEEHGLEAAVVSVDPTFFWYDLNPDLGAAMSEAINEGLKEFCAYCPNRLRWMATLPMQDAELAAGLLEPPRAGRARLHPGRPLGLRRADQVRLPHARPAGPRLSALPGRTRERVDGHRPAVRHGVGPALGGPACGHRRSDRAPGRRREHRA